MLVQMNMIKSPDGKCGLISDMGFNQWLSSVDLSTGAVISQVDSGQQPNDNYSPYGLYCGLALAPGNSAPYTLYAGMGENQTIARLSLDQNGTLTLIDTNHYAITAHDFPSGMATDTNGNLYVANNDPDTFIADFDRMIANNTLPQFIYLYIPTEHTGSRQAPNDAQVFGSASNVQQVADGDVALGKVLKPIMESPVYYDKDSNTGVAIFQTRDDAQSTLDHIHPHRTAVLVMGPFAKPGYSSTRHYNSASIVKTEELLLGLPPNNLGDLMATDLRDFFQPTYNGITSADIKWDFVTSLKYQPSSEGTKIWSLVRKLDTSAPDRDSHRLGQLGRLSQAADELHKDAAKKHTLNTAQYKKEQAKLYQAAVKLVSSGAPKDND